MENNWHDKSARYNHKSLALNVQPSVHLGRRAEHLLRMRARY